MLKYELVNFSDVFDSYLSDDSDMIYFYISVEDFLKKHTIME